MEKEEARMGARGGRTWMARGAPTKPQWGWPGSVLEALPPMQQLVICRSAGVGTSGGQAPGLQDSRQRVETLQVHRRAPGLPAGG